MLALAFKLNLRKFSDSSIAVDNRKVRVVNTINLFCIEEIRLNIFLNLVSRPFDFSISTALLPKKSS
jgi:hypothetical protein